MSEYQTVAELLDYAVEGAEAGASGRQFTRGSKREIREAYRTVAAHVSEHGGFEGRFWKRYGERIDTQLALLGEMASREQGPGDDAMGVAATKAGILFAHENCPIC